MAIFNELNFRVTQNIFCEVLKNQDKGFGYSIELPEDKLTELQIEVLTFLMKCQQKHILGSINIVFKTEGIGEVKDLIRRVEQIVYKNKKYIISNSY